MIITAISVLALGACGTEHTEKTTVGGEQTKRADAVGGQPGPTLTQIRDRIERSCPPSAPPVPPPTGPAETLPPGAKVPSDAIEPIAPAAGPEVELNARDWCASHLHEERIAQALWSLVDPTPTKVRAILNGLGYVDERIHDLEQSGATTRFFLDLREEGGRLCLEGSAAGEKTVVDKCVAPATGPFTPGGQKR
ncbi:hypothetical protein [Streptomyces sp. NPDC000229]|uniref:hypothetical protein n=1 Tax=Streptomyces sp. NPDC000229 TaxID=3154247 RepID=UPI0033165D02